jgi:hypothetical protein
MTVAAEPDCKSRCANAAIRLAIAANPIRNGLTDRKKQKGPATSVVAGPDSRDSPGQRKPLGSDWEGEINRGEPLCTFVNEIIGLLEHRILSRWM